MNIKKSGDREHTENLSTNAFRGEDINLIRQAKLLDRINDGVIALDKEWRIVFINQSGAEMMRQEKPENLIGKNMWGEYPEAINNPFYNAFHKALKTQKTVVMEAYSEMWGRYYENRIYPSPEGLIVFFSDITERKKSEEQLKSNKAFTESIINAFPDTIYIYDLEKNIFVYINTGIQRILGYSSKEIKEMGSGILQALMDPEDYTNYVRNVIPEYYALADNKIMEHDFRFKKKDGDWKIFHSRESVFLRKDDNTPVQIFGILTDITEHRHNEIEKRNIEKRFQQALENIPDVVVIYDKDMRIQFINEATRQVSGRPTSDFIGRREEEIWPPSVYNAYLPALDEAYKTHAIQSVEADIQFPNHELRSLRVTCVPILDEEGKIKEVIGITHDFTEKKRARELLQESEERYRLLVETSPYAICVHQDEKVIFVNPAAIRLLGAKNADEIIGKPISDIIQPDGWEVAHKRIERMLNGETGLYPAEDRYVRLDGRVINVVVTAAPFTFNGKPAVQVIALDISKQKRAEQELADEAVRRRILIEQSRDGIVILDKNGHIQEANKQAAEMLGYTSEEFLQLSVWDWDSNFTKEKILEMLQEVDEKGDFLETKHKRKDGSVFDVEISTNATMFMGDKLIFTVVRDITDRKKVQEDLQKTLTQLRQAVATTIEVLIQAIEIRDPYTAGHQRRVADLARSIAEEIHLPSERIEGIRIAASIHDIGKISVPSEILSKPTRLSETEMALVREHATNGYNILKDVESPWLLAEMVYQHHERMNGTGYPKGLKGDEILLESRILMVADVVEAMASHRPYRPALGLDAALEEIEKNRGILYDERVVDACLKLFKEERFSFK